MSSCKKGSPIEIVLQGYDCLSPTRLISYANWLNGALQLYEKGKMKLSDSRARELEQAYRLAMRRLSGGKYDLSSTISPIVRQRIDDQRKYGR